jgi:hypothetical protein
VHIYTFYKHIFLFITLQMITLAVIWSAHARRIRSTVAGESSLNRPSSPVSFLADAIAFLIAKKMEEARNKEGSPVPYIKNYYIL